VSKKQGKEDQDKRNEVWVWREKGPPPEHRGAKDFSIVEGPSGDRGKTGRQERTYIRTGEGRKDKDSR